MTDDTAPEPVIITGELSYSEATPLKIFIGSCPSCAMPSRIDESARPVAAKISGQCLHCDARMIFERLWAVKTQGVCDVRCMGATGKSCECSCGGENHAGAYRHNRHTSTVTEEAIQRLIGEREKREQRKRERHERRVRETRREFDEWREGLNSADAALVSWMSWYDNVEWNNILVEFRLRMMAAPGQEIKYPPRPLTERQMALAWKIVENKCPPEGGKPVPEGRMTVRGEIIRRRIEYEGSRFSDKVPSRFQILIQCDGYRVWGNCPTDLIGVVWPTAGTWTYEERVNTDPEMPEGLIVEMTATLKRSSRDEYFGFFKNPRSAKIVDEPMIPGLDVSVRDAEALSTDKPVLRRQTKTRNESPSQTSSAPRKSGSHADCTHEATKSARAKCRRARAQS